MIATSAALKGAWVNDPSALDPHFPDDFGAEDLGDDELAFFHLSELPTLVQTSEIERLPLVVAPTFEHFPPSLLAADTEALVLTTVSRAIVATRIARMLFVAELRICGSSKKSKLAFAARLAAANAIRSSTNQHVSRAAMPSYATLNECPSRCSAFTTKRA